MCPEPQALPLLILSVFTTPVGFALLGVWGIRKFAGRSKSARPVTL